MTSEPNPLAAQSFLDWWNLPHSAEGADDPIQFAQAAWSHQQAKIDELEKKLALAREGLHCISLASQNSMTSKKDVGVDARKILAAIDGETK